MAFTGVGFTGTVDQDQFSEILNGIAEHGVLGPYEGSALSAAKVVGARQFRVQPGQVYVPGVIGTLTTVTDTAASSALAGSLPRIDLLVARFTWAATSTVVLAVKEGTPAAAPLAPGLTQTPGSVFEVPLVQAKLTTASGGEYQTADMTPRRYWLQAGKILVPTNTPRPANVAGRVLLQPGALYIGRGSFWETYRSESDTGETTLPAPAGWSGGTSARILNGVVFLDFGWTWTSGPFSDDEIPFPLPETYRPKNASGGYRTIYDTVWVNTTGPTPARVQLTPTTNRISAISGTTGTTLTGSISYAL